MRRSAGSARAPTLLGFIAAAWGAAGLIVLLAFAVARLSGVVVVGLESAWGWHHIAVAALNAVFMAWSEGYRGFQQRFSPRCAARVKWLLDHPSPLTAALAPLFVMGYFAAPRRLMIGVYALTAGIAVAIVIVHSLPQPWRAALDIGVVIGLCWGVASFAWSLWRVLTTQDQPVSPQVELGRLAQSSP